MSLETQSIRGVTKNFGTRETQGKYGARTYGEGYIKTSIWTFDYDDLPGPGTTNQEHVIPAGSTIVSAKLRIVTAFTSTSTTTDLTVGLQQSDATEIDDDGLITAAQATQTTIGTAGNLIDGSSGTAGALINASIGAEDGELVVTPSVDDLTAGRAEMIVEYLIPSPQPAS